MLLQSPSPKFWLPLPPEVATGTAAEPQFSNPIVRTSEDDILTPLQSHTYPDPLRHSHKRVKKHTKPVCNNAPVSGNSSDTSEEIRTYDLKVHPHPVKVVAKDHDGNDGVEVLKNIFDAVSALKLAYLKLQQAHIPYDPKKIVAADDEVVAELEKLCKFRRQYKKMQCSKARFDAALSSQLQAEIEAKEAFLGKLKSQNCAKDCEVLRLQRELQGLEMGNEILIENIKRMRVVKREASVLSVDKFQNVYKAASQSIHNFAKPLISLMKASGWDLDKAANAIETGVVYSRRCDKKYAFEAYIALRMFHGIALSSYDNGSLGHQFFTIRRKQVLAELSIESTNQINEHRTLKILPAV
ncbi:hypothetical protein Ahy_B07g087300 [Arachis hypogaea]|uniref:DUF641 domain-containing protein n=1 Tax=Arachis hypogaea TaxID=3818 RepID=A0A444YBQ7_ARAHY|nr:hypothetical protein Ahy_B07g087300 [Arachis hypogaea]